MVKRFEFTLTLLNGPKKNHCCGSELETQKSLVWSSAEDSSHFKHEDVLQIHPKAALSTVYLLKPALELGTPRRVAEI